MYCITYIRTHPCYTWPQISSGRKVLNCSQFFLNALLNWSIYPRVTCWSPSLIRLASSSVTVMLSNKVLVRLSWWYGYLWEIRLAGNLISSIKCCQYLLITSCFYCMNGKVVFCDAIGHRVCEVLSFFFSFPLILLCFLKRFYQCWLCRAGTRSRLSSTWSWLSSVDIDSFGSEYIFRWLAFNALVSWRCCRSLQLLFDDNYDR